MKIIDQSHEIINLPDNLLQTIEAAGRTCYKSEDKIGCSELLPDLQETCPEVLWSPYGKHCTNVACDVHSAWQFVTRMRDRGHHAMIEFGDIIVRFVTNRGVTHELVRHRLFSFAQESTRYVKYNGGMEFIRPVWCSEEMLGKWESYKQAHDDFENESLLPAEQDFILSSIGVEYSYLGLIDQGWRPEQAREVLPNSLKTEIVVKGNIREFRHMLKLRTSKKAHPQIRHLMLPLLAELKTKIPVVFDDLEG